MVYELANGTTDGGLDLTLVYLSNQLPNFIPALLFLVWIMIVGIGYNSDRASTGRGKMLSWMAIASFLVTSSAMVLYLIPNVINLPTLIIMIAITILFTFFFLFSNND